MSDAALSMIIVIVTVLAVIGLNLGLIAVVNRSNKERAELKTLFRSLKNPFENSDKDIDELSDLVEKIKASAEKD